MHHLGILTSDPEVPAFWRVLATGTDRSSVDFVAFAEALDYPIIASQFHPEKNLFEYFEAYDKDDSQQLSAPVHGRAATRAMAELADFFVQHTIKARFPAARIDPAVFSQQLGFWLFR